MTIAASSRPKVSVIVPTYNRAHLIGDTLASALAQTVRDLEVVVVDDGSTDATPDRVRRIADPRVRYVWQPNTGVSGARNRGLRMSRGEIMSFLDSDDRWKPDKLARELDFLARHPEAGAVFADLEKHDGELFVHSFAHDSPAFEALLARHPRAAEICFDQREMYLCLLQEVPILPSAFTIRRAILREVGIFDESWTSWEDWEFLLRVARRTRIGYLDQALVVLRIGKDSLHRTDARRGQSRMLRLLLAERERLRGDPDAVAATTNGILRLRKRLAWMYVTRGEPVHAFANYIAAFRETRRPRFVLRAMLSLLPARAHGALRRCAGSLTQFAERPTTGL